MGNRLSLQRPCIVRVEIVIRIKSFQRDKTSDEDCIVTAVFERKGKHVLRENFVLFRMLLCLIIT